jgi:hypothetical protein
MRSVFERARIEWNELKVGEMIMNPWMCALLIATAGAIGGIVNALLTDNGFLRPRWEHNVWCPGVISNVLIGGMSAFASWAFYGSGASVELAAQASERAAISLKFSALAGAFLVGVAGARWLTNEVDKRLLKEGIIEASKKSIPTEDCQRLVKAPARQVLKAVEQA